MAATYAGMGGPNEAKMAADGFTAGPTEPGRYRVAYHGRHSSLRYPGFSTFLWGSEVKEEGGKVLVMHRGAWTNVEKYGLNRVQVIEYSDFLYGIAKVPRRWVFNSFGHLTCYLYRGLNNDGRLRRTKPMNGLGSK